VRGSNTSDTIIGSSAVDKLFGLGGADLINAGDGDDVIDGDGVATVNDALRFQGSATVAYTGTVSSLTGLQLTAMGRFEGKSVWQIRNASDSEMTVVLQSASQGNGNNGGVSMTIVVQAHSDYLVTSANLGTHKLYLQSFLLSTLIDTKSASSQTYNNTTALALQNEGDDTINGGNGNDTIRGNGGSDTLNGDAGNDNIDGGTGNDEIRGGEGNDTITGGAGNDKMYGGAGNDTFIVEWSDSGDYYDGGEGIDTFKADVVPLDVYVQEIDLATGTNNWGDTFVSIENIIGSNRNDKFWGTDGANQLWGRAGDDLLDGRAGDDALYGEDGNDTLYGGDGNDTLDGGIGDDALDGGADNDLIYGGAGADKAWGGTGDDRIEAGDGDDTVHGDAGNDALYGDAGVDTLYGDAGNDRITGGAGADFIFGGDGVDTADYRKSAQGVTVSLLTNTGLGGDAEGDILDTIENLSGSAFDDTLIGNDGNNRLTGMSGVDKIYGMGGNDYIATGGGYDYVDGGDGIDTVTYEDSWDRVVVNLTTGKNQYGEASRDVLVNVENIVGSVFNDTITGDAGANRLTGGAGDDTLSGMAGIDYLFGGLGNDKMTGGTEADVFVFEAGFGNDTITDFWAGATRTDRIWLQGTGFDGFDDVLAHATNSAAGAVIDVAGHGTITLTGITVAQLVADDFIFS